MLRILLIDESAERADHISAGIERSGAVVAALLRSTSADLPRQVEALRPDVILIDTDSPSRDTLEHLSVLGSRAPRPVVMFARDGDDEVIRAAVKAGVAAYVVDGLDLKRLKPILAVAIARFEEQQALKRELAETARKLSERKLVERAKGLLMKTRGLDEEAAYAALRRLAMERGAPLAAVARQVIDISRILL
ncbi:MAG: ANTAR domain-containing response regulator [Pseudomonadota bacterium]